MDQVKNKFFITVEGTPNKRTVDRTNAKILHVISWACFALVLFIAREIIATMIGYFLTRVAMQLGVNANTVSWVNLVLIVFYALIYILFFMIGFFGFY